MVMLTPTDAMAQEAQFYGAASSNRAELTLPYGTVVLDYVAAARNESAYFQCPSGLHFPGALGPFGYYNCESVAFLLWALSEV